MHSSQVRNQVDLAIRLVACVREMHLLVLFSCLLRSGFVSVGVVHRIDDGFHGASSASFALVIYFLLLRPRDQTVALAVQLVSRSAGVLVTPGCANMSVGKDCYGWDRFDLELILPF